MELNLENPIFAIYVYTEHMSISKAESVLKEYSKVYGAYKNATFWVFPNRKETSIELIWSGVKYQKPVDNNVGNLIEHVNEILEILSNGSSDAEIKVGLRNLQLSKILD